MQESIQCRIQESELDFPDSRDCSGDGSFWYEVGLWGMRQSLSLPEPSGRPEESGQDTGLTLPKGSDLGAGQVS